VAEGGVARAVEGVENKKKASIFLVEFWSNRQSGGDGGQHAARKPPTCDHRTAPPHERGPHHKEQKEEDKKQRQRNGNTLHLPMPNTETTPLKQTDQKMQDAPKVTHEKKQGT
jgi:hypothetical protein